MSQDGWGGGGGQPGGGQPGGAPPQGYSQAPPGGAPQQGYPQQQQQGYPQQQGAPPQQAYAPAQQAYAPAQQAYAPALTSAISPDAAKGFLAGLIDFSFTTFIATKVIKVLYGLLLIAIVLGMIGSAVTAFDYTFLRSNFHPEGFVQFLAIPFIGAGSVVIARLYCELLVVVFRIAGDLGELNRKTKG